MQQLEISQGISPKSQGQHLAFTVFFVPYALGSGGTNLRSSRMSREILACIMHSHISAIFGRFFVGPCTLHPTPVGSYRDTSLIRNRAPPRTLQ